MATQSHRSNGPGGPTTAGPPESSPRRGRLRSLPIAVNTRGSGAKATMTVSDSIIAKLSRRAIFLLPMLFALWAGTSSEARADACVADRGGLIDGYIDPVPPSQIQIDGNCTIR